MAVMNRMDNVLGVAIKDIVAGKDIQETDVMKTWDGISTIHV